MHVTSKQAAKGAILGALIGDAAGAPLEFGSKVSIDNAMQLCGGGRLRIAPGQITDDGEMMLCLMHALTEEGFSIERISEKYYEWICTLPFDIGYTTRAGLMGAQKQASGTLHIGMWKAAEKSIESKANGALMRITPLGVYCRNVSDDELSDFARQECKLTHSNETCQIANAVFSITIKYLVLNPGDAVGAFSRATETAKGFQNDEVFSWLEDATNNADVGYGPQIGFVKYAFTHAFRHLKQRTAYTDAIRETLSGGGDTDTNACIVGGMIGALHGIDSIPLNMQTELYSCEVKKGRDRPEFLQTKIVLSRLLDGLMLTFDT